MRIHPERLETQLRERLLPVYLVSGDEPLQVGECCDAIRAAARAAGHATREVLEAGSAFDWQQLTAEAAALSLFADRRLFDLRIPSGKPGTEGGRALLAYCADPPPDALLLISLPRIDRQQQGSKWFKAIDTIGAIVQVWPVEPHRLPAWVEQRLRQAGVAPTREAVELLAERVEGNLLAARQEIEKLLLLHGAGPLDVEQLNASVTDSARFDPFDLVDSALRGDPARCLHILSGLRSEGVPPARVLWALHREIRQLARISADVARGASPEQAVQRAKVFARRVGLVRQGATRLRAAQWLKLLDHCLGVDHAIKGLSPESPWLLLEAIALTMCGSRPLPILDGD